MSASIFHGPLLPAGAASSEAHTGTFTVTGIGAATATAKKARTDTFTVTGIGTITVTGVRAEADVRAGPFTTTGIGSVTATGKKSGTGTFIVTGIGTASGTGNIGFNIPGQFTIEGFGGIFVAGTGVGAGVGTDAAWSIDLTGPNGEPSSSTVDFRAATIRWTVDGPGADLAGQFNPPPNGTGPATGYLRASEFIIGVRRDF